MLGNAGGNIGIRSTSKLVKQNWKIILTTALKETRCSFTEALERLSQESAAVSVSSLNLRWLVTDHLGTPRIVFDQTGSLANVSRHDYLPFGEELFAGTGGRTTAQGYSQPDNIRQKFTSKERDNETGLDYFLARYRSASEANQASIVEQLIRSVPLSVLTPSSPSPDPGLNYFHSVRFADEQ